MHSFAPRGNEKKQLYTIRDSVVSGTPRSGFPETLDYVSGNPLNSINK
jgi:hypothetical protein